MNVNTVLTPTDIFQTTIELCPHRNVAKPGLWSNSDVSSFYWWVDFIVNNGIPVSVTIKKLNEKAENVNMCYREFFRNKIELK